MTLNKPKYLFPEDQEAMKRLANDLKQEKNATVRMMMQQKFVKEMAVRYGHERATRMLTQVWRMSKKDEPDDAEN